MKVLNLRCAHDHRFEGWFSHEDDLAQQTQNGLLTCPLCGSAEIQRLPSAPRLNFGAVAPTQESVVSQGHTNSPATPTSSERATVAPVSQQTEASNHTLQSLWLRAVQHVMANTTDVGERFPEEARRIHYGEEPHRPIRGQASQEEVQALHEEGIELMSLPIPTALKGPLQ
ncbi:MAG: hypothetical protein RIS44_3289 [Pseudomonadota bacterium]|jgi:hypothetical protein